MSKNKKIIVTVIFAVVCAAVILTVILIADGRRNDSGAGTKPMKTFDSLEEAVEYAGFPLLTTDRLNGISAKGFSADNSKITVNYGKAGTITKALILDDGSDETDAAPADETPDATTADETDDARVINGVPVTFDGDDAAVTRAEWTDNGFTYAIVLTEQSVTAAMMTDYVTATR